ncbi:hypothetical protein AB3R30_01625 [Leptolyngbyaceae cyanobacterium UHCC 1019]
MGLPVISASTGMATAIAQRGVYVVIQRQFDKQTNLLASRRESRQVRYGERSLQLNILPNEPLRVAESVSQVERQFNQLATQWKVETGMLSVLSQKVLHPAYQRIIGMGEKAVPLLLNELEREPNHWFWALRAITGANPVQPENRGRVKRMAQDWLEWGRDRGYCQ